MDQNLIRTNFYFLNPEAQLPTKAYTTDAGIDFYSIEDKRILPRESGTIHTGVIWQPEFIIPSFFKHPVIHAKRKELAATHNIYMKIESRSGLSFRFDVETGAGIIDETYRGEIVIKIYNNGNDTVSLKKGDKVCQGIIYLLPKVEINKIEALEKTDRGQQGFGSSGR